LSGTPARQFPTGHRPRSRPNKMFPSPPPGLIPKPMPDGKPCPIVVIHIPHNMRLFDIQNALANHETDRKVLEGSTEISARGCPQSRNLQRRLTGILTKGIPGLSRQNLYVVLAFGNQCRSALQALAISTRFNDGDTDGGIELSAIFKIACYDLLKYTAKIYMGNRFKRRKLVFHV
jgi:hypothetical protein